MNLISSSEVSVNPNVPGADTDKQQVHDDSLLPSGMTFYPPDEISLGWRESDTTGTTQCIHKVKNCVADKKD